MCLCHQNKMVNAHVFASVLDFVYLVVQIGNLKLQLGVVTFKIICVCLMWYPEYWSNACNFYVQESVNGSLMNLLTYPWIKDKVNKGELLIHGGYYDFVDCSFEKWTLENNTRVDDQVSIRNREFWSWVIFKSSPLFVLLYHLTCNTNLIVILVDKLIVYF